MRPIDADKFSRGIEDEFHGMISDESLKIYKILNRIEEAETVDAAPVVHGRWLKMDTEVDNVCKCSVCGYPVSYFWGKGNYCINCGANMDGKETE